jgi:hypothetical protein
MEIQTLSLQMQKRIKALETARNEISQLAKRKAVTSAAYDKKLATVIIKLKNGETMSLDGNTISSPPVSIIDKTAKGLCWEQKLDMDTAEALYKSKISEIECIKAELNGFQSINRHLSEGV